LYQLKVASDVASKAMVLQRMAGGGLPTGIPGATSAVATAGTTTAGGATTGAAAASTLSTGAKMMSGAKAGGAMGLVTGVMTGIAEYQQTGSMWKGIFRGLANLAGSVIGGALGAFGGPIGIMLGSMAGSYVGDAIYKMFTKSDDLFSMGYGQRVLMGPEGNFALNNRDTVLAGTNLFGQSSSGGTSMSNISPAGMMTTENRALSPAITTLPALTPAGTSLRTGAAAAGAPQGAQFGAGLEKKLDDLLLMLKEAKTTVTIDGVQQKVPRLQLVQVNSRNEVM
jgi:hypothetical protein